MAEDVVETAPDDRRIYIYIVDRQRRKRRVMILSRSDLISFPESGLRIFYVSEIVFQMYYSMDRLLSNSSFIRVVLRRALSTGENNVIT